MTTYYWAAVSEIDVDIGYVSGKIHTANSIDNAIKNGAKYMGNTPTDYVLISRTENRNKMLLKSNTVGYLTDVGGRLVYESMGSGKSYRISKDGKRM